MGKNYEEREQVKEEVEGKREKRRGDTRGG